MRNVNSVYHIKCSVIQGFSALRKAVTTHVKKISYFFRCVDIANQLLNVTCLWRHSVRFMNERQTLHYSQYKLL